MVYKRQIQQKGAQSLQTKWYQKKKYVKDKGTETVSHDMQKQRFKGGTVGGPVKQDRVGKRYR